MKVKDFMMNLLLEIKKCKSIFFQANSTQKLFNRFSSDEKVEFIRMIN